MHLTIGTMEMTFAIILFTILNTAMTMTKCMITFVSSAVLAHVCTLAIAQMSMPSANISIKCTP